MQHKASKTLVTAESQQDLWRFAVPQIALSHEFLLHGLLAISSLHLGYTHPEKRTACNTVSTRHKRLALEQYSTQFHQLNRENSPAYILLASLIFKIQFFAIADAHKHGRPLTVHDIAHSLLLSQAAATIFTVPSIRAWARSSPLHAILHTDAAPPAALPPPSAFTTHLDELASLAQTADERAAVAALRVAHAVAADAHAGDSVWLWPVTATRGYLEAVGRGEAVAVAVLAHFAALARGFEEGWVVEGWSEAVAAAVEGALDDDGAWRARVAWPLRCVREGVDVVGGTAEAFGWG
ncbi:C6 zinc finger domain-containing protein [Neofusicoccum parvum]|uniref:C6 zinc finger domain-containing protein n=1 Tax=Neofusicoccum parvum TaxID=310453 RepID=A0ACB5SJG9_9PEZI|nr:C6 zinc finger domain-containing protein [Neofusicoccum parvum]